MPLIYQGGGGEGEEEEKPSSSNGSTFEIKNPKSLKYHSLQRKKRRFFQEGLQFARSPFAFLFQSPFESFGISTILFECLEWFKIRQR